MSTDTRQAFEDWAEANQFEIHRDDTDKYRDYHRATTRWAWQAWQAATTASQAELARLHAEVEGLREELAIQQANGLDAARYCWLCEQDTDDDIFIVTGTNGQWGECGHSGFGGFKDLIDHRIDAALAAPKEKPC